MEISPVDGQVIEVRTGESVTLTFPGFGTAGFEWVPEFDASKVALTGREHRIQGSDAGASGAEALTFLPLRPGPAIITLKLKRRWENAARKTVTVTVNAIVS